jgi:Icc-related predicted phosphoesterase
MRVAFVGDIHANLNRATEIVHGVADREVHTIVQTGDFGYWPRMKAGERFLEGLSKVAVEREVDIHWADGNHEDHEFLPHNRETSWEHHPNLFYHPRGTTSEIGGKRFLWFGGAVSVDKYVRTPGYDWFAEEVPTMEQLDRALRVGKVDVLVTHDAPEGIQLKGLPWIPAELQRASDHMRSAISNIVAETKPKLVAHGHWHYRLTTALEDRIILSMGHDHSKMKYHVTFVNLDDLDTIGKYPTNVFENYDENYLRLSPETH